MWKPHTVVCLGDFADFYAMSQHDRSPGRPVDFKHELETVNTMLEQLVVAAKGAKLVFCEGNHEWRYARTATKFFPQDNRVPDTRNVLNLGDFEFVPYHHAYRLGHLFLTHDLEKAGKNAVLQALDDAQDNVIIGHTHRMGTAYAGDAWGRSHVAASFGWLGDVNQVDYKHLVRARREWHLGFGTASIEESGVAHIQAVPIIDYQAIVDGRLYKG